MELVGTGGCTGVGIPGGYGRGIPGYYPAARGGSQGQRSGPGRPAGPGVVVPGGRANEAGGDGPVPPLRGPVGVWDPSLYRTSQIPASWPIKARFNLILLKVSQNGEVSPEYVQKACHSPCFQKLVQKSPLEFLRFPVLLAFSHKELMGLI